jgi:hypothetical protein
MATKNDSGLKVLRIGIVQRGKIIDERELKRRETVSVGTDAKAMFQVASDALPPHFDLFDYDGKDYFIRHTPEMEGRIQASGSEVKTFPDFAEAGQVSDRKGAAAVPLADSSRGKVIIGDVTVLFQFKTRAAAPLRPVLPAELRGSFLQTIDTQFAAILAIVAVVCVSLVAYARSLPYVEPTSIEEIDSRFQRLIMPDRIPQPPRQEVAEVDEGPGADEGQDEEEKKEPEDKPKKQKKSSGDKAAKAPRADIKKKVAGKGLLKVLGANRSGGGGALADVFSEGDDTASSLADAFSGVQGIDIASGSGQKGTRGGGSGEGVGIGDLGTEGRRFGPDRQQDRGPGPRLGAGRGPRGRRRAQRRCDSPRDEAEAVRHQGLLRERAQARPQPQGQADHRVRDPRDGTHHRPRFRGVAALLGHRAVHREPGPVLALPAAGRWHRVRLDPRRLDPELLAVARSRGVRERHRRIGSGGRASPSLRDLPRPRPRRRPRSRSTGVRPLRVRGGTIGLVRLGRLRLGDGDVSDEALGVHAHGEATP